MGFNDPFLVQYGRFLVGALRGDFGQSVRHGEPAFGLVVERMPATFELPGAALLVALALAIPAGIVSAVRPTRLLDYISTVVALLGQSMPTFWLGIMLILVFSVQLNLLPSSGRGTFEHLILPAITLGLFTTARITRLTRSGMLEVLSQDYIRTARAKGVSDPPVVWKHALQERRDPDRDHRGDRARHLLGGSVITETIFAWPGVGRLSVQAIYNRDYPVVQAAVFLLSSTFVLVNLFVDVVYTYLDPRIRLQVSVRDPAPVPWTSTAEHALRPGASGSCSPGVSRGGGRRSSVCVVVTIVIVAALGAPWLAQLRSDRAGHQRTAESRPARRTRPDARTSSAPITSAAISWRA